jgi:hypothetical protein
LLGLPLLKCVDDLGCHGCSRSRRLLFGCFNNNKPYKYGRLGLQTRPVVG